MFYEGRGWKLDGHEDEVTTADEPVPRLGTASELAIVRKFLTMKQTARKTHKTTA